MISREAAARVAVVYEPVTAIHLAYKHHRMMIADCYRTWGRRGAGKAHPI